MVWVIRQYQPDVIITRFPGDKRAGHGHHAASSILANEAFTAAADPSKYPEQFKYGVKPWQAKRIMWNTFNFGNTNTTAEDQLKYDVGSYNPLLGKSYGEIGGEARSMHKSQGEGRPRRKGPIMEYFTNLGGPAPKQDLMDNIDYSWSRITGGSAIQSMIADILKKFSLDQPALSVPALCRLYTSIKALPESNWKKIKLNELQTIIEECSGLFIDATTQTSSVVQGKDVAVTLLINKRQNVDASINRISINNFDSSLHTSLTSNANIIVNHSIHVDDNHPISQPYWLRYPQKEGSFDVRDQALIGKAENPAEYNASVFITINGVDFNITRPVMYKVVDPVKGELYEPLVILPKEEVFFTKNNYISTDGKPVSVTGNIVVNTTPENKITSKLTAPPDWKPVNNYTVSSINKNSFRSVQSLQPVAKNLNNAEKVTLEADLNGTPYAYSKKTIAYDHIPVITYFNRAQANLVSVDCKTTPSNLGYIVGAGDKVPEELQQMGYKVTFLTEPEITDENLKNFDAIIIGIRAYNIYEYLSDKNDVLNRYVKNGGNLIAQYIKSNFVGDKKINIGPYPFSINAGIRVTEENAPVKFLIPDHPVLNYPNKITQKDFEGWVQERSTYQAERADSNYVKPLQMSDSGEAPSDGSLLIAKYGKGNFVYMSLVLFRELPAGVPGAYRLMANCIALPKN